MTRTTTLTPFPADFIFGAATSAYQIEGAVTQDGRGKSVWDVFCHRPGKIADSTSGDVACDHYNRLDADLDLIADLGLNAYRFSIAWPRIQPTGQGQANMAGLDFYNRLVDGLLERGVQPFPTLFHWDTPQALQENHGGFLSRETALRFADYADIVGRSFADRVQNWITVNEPWEHTFLGHVEGSHAPGVEGVQNYFPVMHHILLAHGLATKALRNTCPDADIGITLSLTPMHPHSDSEEDKAAAGRLNEFLNFVILEPLIKGRYPEELLHRLAPIGPDIQARDMETISTSIDFVGVNTYQREFAKNTPEIPLLEATSPNPPEPLKSEQVKDGTLYTTMGWEVYPDALGEVLTWLREDYGNPKTYITENGIALNDQLVDGRVIDPHRINYLQAHLAQVQTAQAAGSDICGYFVWSLMDNFEWAAGCEKRFGLLHVDYETGVRTLKDSAHWYRDLIRAPRA